MPAKKYISLPSNGIPTEVQATVVSSGAGNDGDLVALDSTGKLDTSVMPTGIGAEIVNATASENLSAGDLVSFWNNAGTLNVRKADASAASAGKKAEGFVKAAVTSGNSAAVYTDIGTVNANVSGLTAGSDYYLSGGTPGGVTTTAPTTSGYLVQYIGKALSSTSIQFQPEIRGIRA